jgi:hypothetical protein
MTFKSNQAKYQFYFFIAGTSLIALFSLFVFLGNSKNKKTVVEILEKVKNTGLAEAAVSAIMKKPIASQSVQISQGIPPVAANLPTGSN